MPDREIPKSVPVLTVRDAVHFPGLVSSIHIVREASVEAVRIGLENQRKVLSLSQRDMDLDTPAAKDLFQVGTLSRVQHAALIPEGGYRGTFRGICRVRVTKFKRLRGVLWAEIEPLETEPHTGVEAEALRRSLIDQFGRVVELSTELPLEALAAVSRLRSAGEVADAVGHYLELSVAEKQSVLEEARESSRAALALRLLAREQAVLEAQQGIKDRVAKDLEGSQRELLLREQLRVILTELGEADSSSLEADRYLARIDALGMPEIAAQKARQEARRLKGMPGASSDAAIVRSHLDLLLSLPWGAGAKPEISVARASEVLDKHHFGLHEAKERILDHLAVSQISRRLRGPVLCLVGPPGVGKTSVAKSIADALGLPLQVVSLGGVRDEAEVRGHRRTYVGAMPGRLVSAVRQAGSRSCLIVLDELDKIGQDMRGDPASALLEALDPNQNQTFTDHYLDVPFDLSEVFFIATANRLDLIPAALRDRLEVIEFGSYTDDERFEIAKTHLLPKGLESHGLGDGSVTVLDETLRQLATEYTSEAGVRDLERTLNMLLRKLARAVADGDTTRHAPDATVLLGPPRHPRTALPPTSEVGVATGMVVGTAGGEVIDVEVAVLQGEFAARVRATGNLGTLLVESIETALSHVLQLGFKLPGQIHVHVAQAAIPKDGPSAGLTLALAIASALSGVALDRRVAVTGELSLRGKVLAVGGIREKLAAAKRAGAQAVILPADNRSEVEALPSELHAGLKLHFAANANEAFEVALPGPTRASSKA